MSITLSSTLGETLPTIIEEARHTEQFATPMPSLVWNIKKKLHEGSTVNIPYWGTVTANDLTEGVDMASPQTMSDQDVNITPSEVGSQIIVTDKLVRDNQEDIIRAAGVELGRAMAVKRDQDLIALFGDGQPDIGSNGTMTLGILAAGIARLKANSTTYRGPAPKPYVFVHHPYTILDIIDVFSPIIPTTNTGAATPGGIAENILRNFTVGRLFGVDIIEDGNITASASCDGALFSRGKGGAIILVTANEWEVKPERDESLRATELNIVGEYGVDHWNEYWQVEMSLDATAPTS